MEDREQRIRINFDTNADAAAQQVDGLTGSLDSTVNATRNVTESQTAARRSTKGLGSGLEDLGGPVGGAISGFKGMIKQMWLLVANPIVAAIVAIVGVLALVFKAFTSTNDGADKLEQIMAGLSATVDVLRDRFLKLVSLDFKGAFGGVGDEISKEFKDAAKLAESLQEVEDATRSLGVSRAKLNRDLSAAKELITDETASYGDKKKAIEDVRKAEGEQTNQELANAQKKFESIKAQNKLSKEGASDEDLQKQADAQTAVFNLQKEQSDNKRAFNKLDKKADNEEKGRLKEITDAKNTAFKEQLAIDKAAKATKAAADKIAKDERLALIKEGIDKENALRIANEDLLDKTDKQKLQRQKERAAQEIKDLEKKGIATAAMIILNDAKFKTLTEELEAKKVEEKKVIDEEKFAKDIENKATEAANEKLDFESRLRILAERDALILANTKLTEEEKNKLLQDNAKKRADIEKAEKDFKEQQLQKNLDNLQNILSIGGKKMQKVSKALAIADVVRTASKSVGETVASIGTANAKSIAASPLTGGMPFVALNTLQGGLQIGSTIASAAKAIQNITSEGKSAPSGGGGLAGGGGGGGAPSATSATPQVSFQASSENQIGNTLANNLNAQPPIEAYVVGKSVTDQQQLDNNKINANSI
jgi:hypothetical protein